MNNTGRINRILFILSYVSQNQGVTVEELAAKAGMRSRALLRELEFISLIGKPPFNPDDYVDIYVENGRVYSEMDQGLNRPFRFTRAEAMALMMSLELLDPEVDPQGVRSLREKLAGVMGDSVKTARSVHERIALESSSRHISDQFRIICTAVEERQKLEIRYYALGSNRTTRRVIRPYHLMKRLGFWYLTAYCEKRKDLRTFKFERILSVSLQDERFDPPEDFDLEKYQSEFLRSTGEREIRIHFDEPAAPWIREQWRTAVEPDPAGGIILTLHSETLEFASRLTLRWAPHSRPVAPPEFVEKVRQDARDLLGLPVEASC